MIWALVFFIVGGLTSLIVFTKKPKIEIPESKDFEQIEKEIKEWLASPIVPIKKEKQLTTAIETDLWKSPIEKTTASIPLVAFERHRGLYTAGQVT